MILLRKAASQSLTARQCIVPSAFARCLLQLLSRRACLAFIALQHYTILPFPYLTQSQGSAPNCCSSSTTAWGENFESPSPGRVGVSDKGSAGLRHIGAIQARQAVFALIVSRT